MASRCRLPRRSAVGGSVLAVSRPCRDYSGFRGFGVKKGAEVAFAGLGRDRRRVWEGEKRKKGARLGGALRV